MEQGDVIRKRVLHQALKDKAARFGNREFLRFGEESFGYQDFDQAADRVAAGLQALGVGKGDKVAIMAWGNRPGVPVPLVRPEQAGRGGRCR